MITIDMIRLGIRNRTLLPLNQISKQMSTTGNATKNQWPLPSASIHDLIPSIYYNPSTISRVVIGETAHQGILFAFASSALFCLRTHCGHHLHNHWPCRKSLNYNIYLTFISKQTDSVPSDILVNLLYCVTFGSFISCTTLSSSPVTIIFADSIFVPLAKT